MNEEEIKLITEILYSVTVGIRSLSVRTDIVVKEDKEDFSNNLYFVLTDAVHNLPEALYRDNIDFAEVGLSLYIENVDSAIKKGYSEWEQKEIRKLLHYDELRSRAVDLLSID